MVPANAKQTSISLVTPESARGPVTYGETTVITLPEADAQNAPTSVIQFGQIVKGVSNKGVPGAIVYAGSYFGRADPDGVYGLAIPQGLPFFMTITAPGYYKIIEAETILKTSINRHRVPMVSRGWGKFLDFLLGRNPSTGVLIVAIESLGKTMTTFKGQRVTDVDGATVSVHSPNADVSQAKVKYIRGGIVSSFQKAARIGEATHAVVYNLPVGADIIASVKHPRAASLQLPVVWRGVTYTPTPIQTEPGESLSYTRVWIE